MTEAWPNHELWSACRQGAIRCGDRSIELSTIDCGHLEMPSGRLVVCDPFAAMRRIGNPEIQIPPGRHRVVVTLADVSEEQDGSHIREAYASLLLTADPDVRREVLTPLCPGEAPPAAAEPGTFVGFPVDAGTACFVDAVSLKRAMPPDEEWHEELFESDEPDCWFARMDDPEHIRDGIANIPLPVAQAGENLVLFHSGWGDDIYPLIGGYSADGRLVAVHVDFFVVPASPEEES